MAIYLRKFTYFETINENLKTTKLLNVLLILYKALYKAQCTTTPMCNVGSVGICKFNALNTAAKFLNLAFIKKN